MAQHHEQITRQQSVDCTKYSSTIPISSELGVGNGTCHKMVKQKAFRPTRSLGTPPRPLGFPPPTDAQDDGEESFPPTSTINSTCLFPKALNDLFQHTGSNRATTSDVLKIVQHIASYLSLCDVGSVANLYSSFASFSSGDDEIGCSSMSTTQNDRTAWKSRGEDEINPPQITLQQQPCLRLDRSCSGTIRSSSSTITDWDNVVNHNKIAGSNGLMMGGAKERDLSSLGSGPDECAGLGLDATQNSKSVLTFATSSSRNGSKRITEMETESSRNGRLIHGKITLSQIFSSTIRNEVETQLENTTPGKIDETILNAEAGVTKSMDNSPTMSTPPGLVSLSPVAQNLEPYNYYDNELEEGEELFVEDTIECTDEYSSESDQYICRSFSSSEERDEKINDTNTKDNVFRNQAETIRLENIQRRLRKCVLSHPYSIRYFSKASSLNEKLHNLRQTKQKNQPKRCVPSQKKDQCNWEKDEDKSSPSQLLSSICASSDPLTTRVGDDRDSNNDEVVDVLSKEGEKSPAVLSVTEDEDEDIDGDIYEGKETEEEVGDYLDQLVSCFSRSKKRGQQRLHQHSRQTPPPPAYIRILRLFTDPIFQNIPLSIIFDASSSSLQILLQTFESGFFLASTSIRCIIRALAYSIHASCSNLALTLHPKRLLEFFMHLHQRAMRTRNGGGGFVSHAFSSVKNSVVGSYLGTSSMMKAVYSYGGGNNFSSDGDGTSHIAEERLNFCDTCRRAVDDTNGDSDVTQRVISEKMFRKINRVDSIAKVISYVERQDDALSLPDKRRVKRMMHYPVSLRPFVATIEIATDPAQRDSFRKNIVTTAAMRDPIEKTDNVRENYGEFGCICDSSSESNNRSSELEDDDVNRIITPSPFMCTPKSFPPTPDSRAYVLATGTKFADDVIFLARDQLRVEKSLESANDKTRAMARALLKGSRLAIFNAVDISGGITLTCGQHCAFKVGNDLYCSARGMIPILRNCFVYFEMSVSTPPPLIMTLHHASLSVGLSTLGMPLNVLVGAWKGSAGLCSTGQILTGSQWCSPMEPRTYGSGSVVGCLVYLDDESAIETQDGVMVPARIVFNIDGQVVIPKGTPCNSGCGDNEKEKDMGVENQQDDLCLDSSIPLLIRSGEELFPTLTLHSSQTEVKCRFCSEDLTAKSRREIGAPTDETIYAIDGSVVFEEEEA